MPEDQDQSLSRRRPRRQEISAGQEQPESTVILTIAQEQGAPPENVTAPGARRRAPGRAVASADRNRKMKTMDMDTDTTVNGTAAGQNGTGAEETAARRRRVSRSKPSALTEPEAHDPATTGSETSTPTPRAARGRRARATESTEATSPAALDASASPVVPTDDTADTATGTARTSRGRRGRRDAQQVDEPARAETSTAASTASAPQQPEASAPIGMETRPAPSYRFDRPRADGHAGEETPASSETAAPAQETPPPAMRGVAYQPGMRPQRRFDRTGQEPREGRPAASGFDPYRRPSEPGAPRGSGPRGGQQRPPAPGAPGAPRGPYMPGGRGQQQGGPARENPQAPQPASHGANGTGPGAAPTAGGYTPYTPYEPYGNPPGHTPGERDRAPGPGRPLRNRGYTGQPGQPGYPGYGDQRGPRGPQSYRDRDSYREPGGHAPYERRGSYGDRRGFSGGRGSYGRTPREPGYDRTYYPPAAPTGQETRYGPESRYSTNLRPQTPATLLHTVEVTGILWLGGGVGLSPAEVLDGRTLLPVARMNPEDARRMGLRSGDEVRGRAEERGGRRLMVAVESVNGVHPDETRERPVFEQLTASFPDRRIRLEQGPQPISSRIIDLFAPLGFGSRALIVAPPKTGKTTLIREAAESVLKGYPDAVVMAVLVGERPEEVTDLRARLEPRGGLVYAASFDEDTQRHAWLVAVAVERAKRVAESGKDAFMVLDSLTRLARAENLASRGQGRTLSGGIDAQALDTGRRAFGAARNLEEGGSLTILATCLVDTGSRQDDVVYEEFKGTGNMELHLSRDLAQRRLFPAIDAVKSGTRREENLLTSEELRAATALRRRLADLPAQQATQQLLSVMERTPSNSALLQAIEQSGWTGNAR